MSNKSALGAFSPYNPDYGKNAALLAFAATMLQNAGRQPFGRGAPISTAQALGSGALAGLGAYGQAEQQQYARTKPNYQVINDQLVSITPPTERGGKPTIETIQDLRSSTDNLGKYDPSDYTTDSWNKFLTTKNPKDLDRYVAPKDKIGTYDPSDYTPKSWSKFERTKMSADLVFRDKTQAQAHKEPKAQYLYEDKNGDGIFSEEERRLVNTKFDSNTGEMSYAYQSPKTDEEKGWHKQDKDNPEVFVPTGLTKHFQKQEWKDAADAAKEGAMALSRSEQTYLAEKFIITGKFPPFGRGYYANLNKVAVMRRAFELQREAGITEVDYALNSEYLNALGSAERQLSKQFNMVKAFEDTARRNIKLVRMTNERFTRSGVPIIDVFLNPSRAKTLNEADQADMKLAIKTLTDEYAKILSGNMGNAPLSDDSRKSAAELLNTEMKSSTIESVLDMMELEMENRVKGFNSQFRFMRDERMRILKGETLEGKKVLPVPLMNLPADQPDSGWVDVKS